ncbi:hypothetical protein L195_g028787 [Trifolium pratense]|uniref:Uncharacterized protein n=1 Tax=Trifolium pratense TaxID=57577 RepID=A0A2K3L2Z9_TRIPR|nr:hypothetical protein L195_g028787 [Trifolium pratense]
MLSSLASFFPMISPRAESIAPETQGFRESLIRALILLSIVGRQDRKGITSSMGKPNPGIPSQQPTSAYRESRLRQCRPRPSTKKEADSLSKNSRSGASTSGSDFQVC